VKAERQKMRWEMIERRVERERERECKPHSRDVLALDFWL